MAKHHFWKLVFAIALTVFLFARGVSATTMVFDSPLPHPSTNNSFYTALAVTSLPYSDAVDMAGADLEPNEPYACNSTSQTVWYSYTPAANEMVRVTLSGLSDANLAIYQANGSDIASLSYLNCASWGSPSLTFSASAGQTYYFQVGAIYGYGQIAQLNVELVLPPANDNFDAATSISGTYYYQSVDVTGATTEAGEPQGACCETPQHTIWYAFTPLENGAAIVSLWGNDSMNTILNAYRADGPGLGGLSSSLGHAWYGGGFSLNVQANQTYYFQVGTIWSSSNVLNFSMSFTPAPANDNFADAKLITSLPYDDSTEMTAAAREDNEPSPSCGYMNKTVWYKYAPTESGSLSQRSYLQWGWFSTVVAAYTGDSLNALTEVACSNRSTGNPALMTFHVNAGTTYFFQLATNDNTSFPFHLEVAPPPIANFGYNPYDASIFDSIYFNDWSSDPAGVGIQAWSWSFGDGTTATGSFANHRYATDGDYTVQLTVTTTDGRTASTTRTVSVKTHDVTITKFTVPQSAKAGQTRQLAVSLNSRRYVEEVEVQLYKSLPGYSSWQWIGTLRQTVPVRPANRTTEFSINYTFTTNDASIGKVTFRAVATIVNARDALPADNEAIGLPTKVSR